jgi:DNA-binding transcriptional regulator YhcF (GntR family)
VIRTDQFIKWLTESLDTLACGTMLPSDSELASTWNLSRTTVRRTLAAYARKGRVTRLKGKGTVVGTPGVPPVLTPGNCKVDAINSLTDHLLKAIRTGELKCGDPLPSYKNICMNFQISPASVAASFRRLCERGLVIHTGKYFRVGGFLEIARNNNNGEVVFFYEKGIDLGALFTIHEAALSLNKMENELLRNGCRIIFDRYENLEIHLHRWSSKGCYPRGLIFSGNDFGIISRNRYDEIAPSLRQFAKSAGTSCPGMLMLTRNYRPSEPFVHCISLSHAVTMTRRRLASFLFRKGITRISLFLRERTSDPHALTDLLRFVPEFDRIDSSFSYRFVICPLDRHPSAAEFLKRCQEIYEPGHFDSRLSKYRPITLSSLEGAFLIVKSFEKAFEGVLREEAAPGAWVFYEDSDAVAALDWCGMKGVKVPRNLSIIGLENNRLHVHRGITSCVRDWETIGYLMAHAILGDIPLMTTSKGYIQHDALLLERATTPRS